MLLAASPPPAQRRRRRWACAAVLLMPAAAPAADLGTADGFNIQWDTTVRQSVAFRTESANPALLADINGDDGDRAFTPGLISGRLDIFSELTAARGNLGFAVSAQGWYDPVYQQGTANHSPKTFNPFWVPYDQFPSTVRHLMGNDGEILNAYVKDTFNAGDTPISVRLGRQTLLWGESLFFANNGIAAGQAPVDGIKALSAPLAEARELYLPVTQAVVRVEIRPGLAIELYDQFEWRRDRLPGVASYFSTTDILDTGGDRVLLPGGGALFRDADSKPHGIGQFGAALRLQSDAVDYGLYALRYDAKDPEPVFNAAYGTYQLIFPRGIEIYGASASTYLGTSNIAGEISVRRHMPLAAGGSGLPGGVGAGGGPIYAAAAAILLPQTPAPISPQGGYATGNTLHAQASTETELPPSHLWQSASLQAELAANDLLEVTSGHPFVQPGRTHLAASLQIVFTPSWFQILPGLDISLPAGVEYTPIGRSSIDGSQNNGTGNISVGVSATYRTNWQAALSFTHFIGGAGQQKLADRDFIIASATRTF
jgi:hypothetical protein